MKTKSKAIKISIVATIFLIVAFVLILNFHISTEPYSHTHPIYERTDIPTAFKDFDFTYNLNVNPDKSLLTGSQYEELLMQTGIGKIGIDVMIERIGDNKKIMDELEMHQKNFWKKISVTCEKIGWITYEEHVKDKLDDNKKLFDIVDVKEGDVLITKNTHSLGWRHGHSAIVIDEKGKSTLEAVMWGENSSVQHLEKWETYPHVILLRPKDETIGEKASSYAKKNMEGIIYGLLTGIPLKAPENVKKTQCAHIIWYPYNDAGIDIDYDTGWLVTPKDIANSNYFDVVQVYGADPRNPWI